MRRHYFKPIMAGVLLGAALFWMPGILKLILVAALIGGAIRFFARRRFAYAWHAEGHSGKGEQGHHHHRGGFGGGWGPWAHPAFMEKVRNMSDEEYDRFRSKFQSRWKSRCGHWDAPANPPAQDSSKQDDTSADPADSKDIPVS